MKKEQTMEAYEAPRVKVVEVEVEKGYAVSGYADDTNGYHDFGAKN